MDTHNFSFENLKVYSNIWNLVRDIYRIQEKFPQKEQYAFGRPDKTCSRNTFQNKITKTPLPDNSITNNQ